MTQSEYEKKRNEAMNLYCTHPLEKDFSYLYQAGSDFGREYQRGVEDDLNRKLHEAAKDLLNNYLKDVQYPENITFNSKIVGPLREAVISLDAYNKSKDVK